MNQTIPTKMRRLNIGEFRALKDLDLSIANRITLICGKNGTSKSTVLGLIAQFFNFDRDYVNDISLKELKTIYDKPFKSKFSEHFRLSKTHDKPHLMKISTTIFDGYTQRTIDANLQMTDHADRSHRMVVRQLREDGMQGPSRNFTHPVIYLNLKRLLPITERKYATTSNSYLSIEENHNEFCSLTNRMLLRANPVNKIASTRGSIDASVSHGDAYDQESVSVGEDNVGQICSALLSFKKLKEQLGTDYKGGLLLIDEADAGLFPASQKEFIKILNEYSSNYDLQIVLTTHSPLMINEVLELQRKASTQHVVHYLTYVKGIIKDERNRSWEWIKNDLLIQTSRRKHKAYPTVTLFFEDVQASDFFSALIYRTKYKKFVKIVKNVSLGYTVYVELSKVIPEIDSGVIIVLDGDANPPKNPVIIKLPTRLPPDQLLFWVLYNISEDDDYWENSFQFTREVFMRNVREVNLLSKLPQLISEEPLSQERLTRIVNEYSDTRKKPKARQLFKAFSKAEDIHKLLSDPKLNPFARFIKMHSKEKENFLQILERALVYSFKKQLNMTEQEVKKMMGI